MNCRELASYLTTSPKLCPPMAKILFPSGLGTGACISVAPAVNCIPCRLPVANQPPFCRIAQRTIVFVGLWHFNTKHLPSPAQLPPPSFPSFRHTARSPHHP